MLPFNEISHFHREYHAELWALLLQELAIFGSMLKMMALDFGRARRVADVDCGIGF